MLTFYGLRYGLCLGSLQVMELWGYGVRGLWGYGVMRLRGYGVKGLWGYGVTGLWGYGFSCTGRTTGFKKINLRASLRDIVHIKKFAGLPTKPLLMVCRMIGR